MKMEFTFISYYIILCVYLYYFSIDDDVKSSMSGRVPTQRTRVYNELSTKAGTPSFRPHI